MQTPLKWWSILHYTPAQITAYVNIYRAIWRDAESDYALGLLDLLKTAIAQISLENVNSPINNQTYEETIAVVHRLKNKTML